MPGPTGMGAGGLSPLPDNDLAFWLPLAPLLRFLGLVRPGDDGVPVSDSHSWPFLPVAGGRSGGDAPWPARLAHGPFPFKSAPAHSIHSMELQRAGNPDWVLGASGG